MNDNILKEMIELDKLVFNGEDIVDENKCLFTSLVAHSDYQASAPLVILWRGFLNKLKNLNVTISSVIADCVSEKGENLAIHGLNAKFITNSHNGKIYEGNISEILDLH